MLDWSAGVITCADVELTRSGIRKNSGVGAFRSGIRENSEFCRV
jgi:hypothetical protein